MKKVSVILIVLLSISFLTGCKEKKLQQSVDVADRENATVVKTEDKAEAKTMFCYVKFDGVQANGQMQLFVDELLWIRGDDAATLLKYGYDPDDVFEDFRIHNEVEEWVPIVTNPETAYRIIVYDDNAEMVVQHIDVDRERFKQHLSDGYSKYANVTISPSGYVYSVNEFYVP